MTPKYTRENLTNEALFTLREKARAKKHAALDIIDAVDLWMRHRDEPSLRIVLDELNRDSGGSR